MNIFEYVFPARDGNNSTEDCIFCSEIEEDLTLIRTIRPPKPNSTDHVHSYNGAKKLVRQWNIDFSTSSSLKFLANQYSIGVMESDKKFLSSFDKLQDAEVSFDFNQAILSITSIISGIRVVNV